jgi:hypothetical protein
MSSQHITQTAVTARRPSAALRKAVEAYRTEHKGMETWARELLERLARSDDAAKAFERLKLKDGRERVNGGAKMRRLAGAKVHQRSW